MNIFLYIISIALQVSGALLLMIFSISTKREKIIKKFINKDIVTEEGNSISYNKEELKETFRVAYLNRFSFGYIAFGYLISVFGETNNNKWLLILYITLSTIIFMSLAYLIVFLIMKKSSKVNKELTLVEMQKINVPSTMNFITNEDIDKLFDDEF